MEKILKRCTECIIMEKLIGRKILMKYCFYQVSIASGEAKHRAFCFGYIFGLVFGFT